ncbi:MAG TPA: aldehyde dehydrogenase family protein [Azospira sp.]|nr:aldehyde dehydrogenase family protein [Azospira sp.]
MSEELFSRLGLSEFNPAAALGDGSWRDGHGGFASMTPALGLPLALVGRATADDIEAVVARSLGKFHSWREVPAPRRGLVVRDIAAILRERKDDLATLLSIEVGKIKAEAEGEIQEMIDIAEYAQGLSRQLYGLTLASERPRHHLLERWQPLGPVAVITAFNFPAAVWAWNAFIAAVCGDTVIWKPSPKAPLTAIAIQRLVEEVCDAHGACSVFTLLLSDLPRVVETLAADRRIPLVSFTGSSAVGRQIARTVAERFGRCLLECSGNNAAIIDASADLDLAIPAVVFGAVGTAGQRCTTTRRLLVHQERWNEVVARLSHAYAQLTLGDPLTPGVLVGPLIDEDAREAFVLAVAEAHAQGGQLLWGGRVRIGHGFFVDPTLITAENHWPVVQRETFAPILYLIPCKDFDTALRYNNEVPQGLSSALFTLDMRHAERFLAVAGSDCGIANINVGTSGAEIGGAFGGEKETGGGREAGSDAWKAYMRRQTQTINYGTQLPLAQGIRFDLPG